MHVDPPKIGPDDPRYRAVVDKRFNKRFAARPDYVQLVTSADQVESALGEAVSAGRRVVVTSGGHCLEGFVADPDVRVILDISPMKRVYFDAERGAVAIEAGATVGEALRAYRSAGAPSCRLASIPASGSAATSQAARSDFSVGSSALRRTICMP